MKAAIVTIGDEILIGQITDTNSGFIAKSLDRIGIQTIEMLSIGDDHTQILETFRNLQDSVQLVVITGGLGPTKDDITKKTFCNYFSDELIVDHGVLTHITEMYERIFKTPVSQVNKDQALVPSKSTVLKNDFGSAPGMWMQKGQTVFVAMPGVPFEMKGIVEKYLIPKLVEEFKRPYIIHKTVLTYGQGESLVAARIEQWENDLPDIIKLAYLPSPGRVRLRLTARGDDKQMLQRAIDQKVELLKDLIGDIIVGYEEEDTLEVVIGRLLANAGKTVSVAESCTGGKLSQVLTSVPGASKYFLGSVVPYSAEAKIKLLGIDHASIERYSAVSQEIAIEMAIAAKKLFNSDYAISTTGNAGPTTDKTDREIGIVFIAIARPDGSVEVREFNFGQPREKVIDRSVNKSLEMLREEILKLT